MGRRDRGGGGCEAYTCAWGRTTTTTIPNHYRPTDFAEVGCLRLPMGRGEDLLLVVDDKQVGGVLDQRATERGQALLKA